MSDAPTLTFLPWLRRGLARSLATTGSITASVQLSGKPISSSLRMLGPGSVIGLAEGEVLVSQPPADTQDASLVDFVAVELATPDLPWMFTPAKPNADKLAPWLVLIVVEAREGVELDRSARPLARLRIADAANTELPPLTEAWMWAHVQITSEGPIDAAKQLDALLANSPERVRARLLCPRRLAPSKRWIAAIVPSFEAGRLAGLGATPTDADATKPAWTDATTSIELPVYHHFEFRTAARSIDFEQLVRGLEPRALPSDAGMAELDIGEPGTPALPSAPGTRISLLGALAAPDAKPRAWPPAHRAPFEAALRKLVDEGLRPLAAAASKSPYDPRRDDPVVAPPAYGALPAGLTNLPNNHWVTQLDLDPAARAIAGIGAALVGRDQESLMAEAWSQAAGLREVNRQLARTRLAAAVGARLASRVSRLADPALVQITRTSQARLAAGPGETLRARVEGSMLPRGLISGAARRRLRPGTPLAKASMGASSSATLANPLTRKFIEKPALMLAFARPTVPSGVVFDEQDQNAELEPIAKQPIGAASSKLMQAALAKTAIGGKSLALEQVELDVRPLAKRPLASEASAPASPASIIGKQTLSKLPALTRPSSGASALAGLATLVRQKLDPGAALAKQLRARIRAPESAWTGALPKRMLASIDLDWPAAERLADLDPELILPGVGALPRESAALAKVNHAFVEALLIGANHALAREFVWRELACNLRDTFVHRFWTRIDPDARDIGEIASWPAASALGSHVLGLDAANLVVLVIRSELLRRFPDTLIYAIPARAGVTPPVEDEAAAPSLPVLLGKLGPDTQYFGFVLPKGANLVGTPGWMFVFEQAPTRPRFGLDGDDGKPASAPTTWSDLSWKHVGGGGSHVRQAPAPVGKPLPYDDVGDNTWTETWARNAAAMARICLQRPARLLIHARDLIQGGP
ncbi:hypothetical protein ACNOYE_22985 [Nannocystaceae bacterium ST9]